MVQQIVRVTIASVVLGLTTENSQPMSILAYDPTRVNPQNPLELIGPL